MDRNLLTIAVAGALTFAGALPASAQGESTARLTVATSAEHGAYIADAEGRALYMFEADQRGEGEDDAVSDCYDACAEAWPPLIAEGSPAAAEQVQADLMATIERSDGTMQVTYGGWPLYYYVQDQGAGQTTGHDVEGFGGEWYLVSPSGEIVGHESTTAAPEASTGETAAAADTAPASGAAADMDTAAADADARNRAVQSAEGAGMTNVQIMDRVFVVQGMTPQGETVFMIVNPPGALIGLGAPVGSSSANPQ